MSRKRLSDIGCVVVARRVVARRSVVRDDAPYPLALRYPKSLPLLQEVGASSVAWVQCASPRLGLVRAGRRREHGVWVQGCFSKGGDSSVSSVMWMASSAMCTWGRIAGHRACSRRSAGASRRCSARIVCTDACRSSCGQRGGCVKAALRAVAPAALIACRVRRSASVVDIVSYGLASRRLDTSVLYRLVRTTLYWDRSVCRRWLRPHPKGSHDWDVVVRWCLEGGPTEKWTTVMAMVVGGIVAIILSRVVGDSVFAVRREPRRSCWAAVSKLCHLS